MQLSHALKATSAVLDEPNLVSAAGLVPMLALAEAAGLARRAQQQLSVPTDKGANAGLKVASLVAGMVAGADSIDDMRLLRHGGMGRVFTGRYAASTLGSFLRSFTFGHVRQLDAVAALQRHWSAHPRTSDGRRRHRSLGRRAHLSRACFVITHRPTDTIYKKGGTSYVFVDEVRPHLVPVLLGGGTRLFDGVRSDINLVPTTAVTSGLVTHLTYRVIGGAGRTAP
jgi:hypothetical protein